MVAKSAVMTLRFKGLPYITDHEAGTLASERGGSKNGLMAAATDSTMARQNDHENL